MKTCLVVPCYLRNRKDEFMLRRLIDSALRQKQRFRSIIVVDDASPHTFNHSFSGVDCIRAESNSGPAHARNKGIEKALELESSYVLFADHDCILSSDWSLKMTEFMNACSYESAGGLTRAYGKTMIDKFHDINGTLNGRVILPERKHLLYTPTCNFAISHNVAEDFRFDTRYRNAAGEDVDYCLRIRKEYPIGFCRDALVWHDFGYRNILSGILKMTAMFKKYKEANSLLYKSYPEYFANAWYESEAIDARSHQ